MEIKKRYVGAPVPKKDSAALLAGKPLYTNDIAPKDCLIVKVLRSPHAFAWIEEIDIRRALLVPGIETVLTWKDSPQKRFTMAGQTYPEPSPHDRLILDRWVRFVGDAVAIVAGEDEACVDKALKLIRVKYRVLTPVLDFRTAKDNPVLVHPEDNWEALCPVGADNKRNLCAHGEESNGDVDAILKECDYVVEQTYHVKADQQAMMETFRTFTQMDPYGRLIVTSSTQIAFHCRRIVAHSLNIPKSKVRVIKPRIGGGFGAKQSAVAEIYPALVTWLTGKPAKMLYTRYESQIASSPRHEMEVTVRMGADKNGVFRALEVYTLSNTGAFGEHGPTTVGLSGHKSIPLYRTPQAFRFSYDVVYTNTMAAGAYRGYGATQGIFAVESAVNELAEKLQMDPAELRRINMVREGDVMPAYYGETCNSCALDRCLIRAKELMRWDDKFPYRVLPNGKVRAVGMALAMQGSSIAGVDVGSVRIKLEDDGFYTLMIGAADMGTGCDTILAQIAADCLCCDLDKIVVHGVDTDSSPYDSGSYASSTTYLTGMATVKTCEALVRKMAAKAAEFLKKQPEEIDFDGEKFFAADGSCELTLAALAWQNQCFNSEFLEASEMHTSPVSPPPFMVGMAEIEMDRETGYYEVVHYAAVVDCGTAINPNLARVQTEGGIGQGIGMAMYEDVTRDSKGTVFENSFMQYKIPTRMDIGKVQVEIQSSYEPTGPFGAKSIGEIVINTPSPAIAAAVARAAGVHIRDLPITAEKVYRAMHGTYTYR